MNDKYVFVHLFCIVMSVLSILTNAVELSAQKFVVLHLQDGALMEFALSDDPVITFDSENIILTGSSCIEFPLKDMVDIEYLENSIVNANVGNSLKPFIRKNNVLIFSNFESNTPLNIFGLDGTSVFSHIIPSYSIYEYNLDNLKSGVYIININKVSYKLIK